MTFDEMYAELAEDPIEDNARRILAIALRDGTPWAEIMPLVVSTMKQFGNDDDRDIARRFDTAVYSHLADH